MTTFCKTSQGGFNLERVEQWEWTGKVLYVYLNDNRQVTLRDEEATRALAILEGICIFDTTKETK